MVVRRPAPQGVCRAGPTRPDFAAILGLQPGLCQVQNERSFMTGWMDIIQGGMAPQAAAEKALKRVAEIFAKYPISSS